MIPVFILAIIFGSITLWRLMAMKHKERMAKIDQGTHAGDPKMLAAASAREGYIKELEGRVQHLETIVCSVDFELNAKINRLASHQLQLGDAATKAMGLMAEAGGASAAATRVTPAKPLFSLEPGQRLGDRFVIERNLGHGGMGAVYLANDERLTERVALKIMHGMALLDPSASDRLRREASAARRISHANVVKIHDVGEDQGHLFLSMEYVEGQSLAQLISRHAVLPLERVRGYVSEICEGLAAAHAQGVIHRDLKPANVIVTPDQRVKIIDFGLARVANLEGMTATGMLLGTPEYMAPEQIKGGNLDGRTDLYALGALTYHAITGRPPFTGDTPIGVSLAQATEQPIPPSALRPGLEPAWDTFVLTALNKAKEDRFETAQAMRDALPRG
ncbi:serine/threonine protein kinase [Enhygromyxa salina]|uniref:non-specific serine/threonine protein kinase n=1 Tax=Enhygromyxa salina TaxID=215803 RepID=A0A0C2CRV1_9BACT|nr:serine/threonine-protein kinase [Enhygromyxa salina]KIG12370.1 serine/threonine protein kinase [Enhygromyxa salina]